MSDLSLFDLEEPEWVVVGEWGRCGLCGTKCSFNQGGTTTGAVCDDCAQVDGCSIREHNPIVERRPSPFSMSTDQVAHCDNCGWWVNADHRNDDGDWVPLTGDEVLDLCAEHARPRHTSHWGVSHEIAQHDALVAAQAKRRANYRKAVAA